MIEDFRAQKMVHRVYPAPVGGNNDAVNEFREHTRYVYGSPLDADSIREMVSTVNKTIIDFYKRDLGLPIYEDDFYIDKGNILVMKKSEYIEDNNAIACFEPNQQLITFYYDFVRRATKAQLLKTLIHEMVHFAGYHRVKTEPFLDGYDEPYTHISTIIMGGARLYTKKDGIGRGVGLEEALTEETAIMILKAKQDSLKELSDTISMSPFSYLEHRRVLFYIIDRLLKVEGLTTLEDRNRAFDYTMKKFILFRITGRAYDMANIVNKAVGDKRAFRVLMRMGSNPDSAVSTLSKLKEMSGDY